MTTGTRSAAKPKKKAPKKDKAKPAKAAASAELATTKGAKAGSGEDPGLKDTPPPAQAPQGPAQAEPQIHCAYRRTALLVDLRPNPRNPNKHPEAQLRLLAKVITTAGWRSPIVVSNRSGLIVKGHGRFEAAKLAGLTVAPVDFQDYATAADEMADMIADNRLAELAEIDDAELKELLKMLDDGSFDMDLTGFGADELADLMLQVNPTSDVDAEPQMDRAEELNQKWKVALGDVWAIGKHRLICGDATDAGTVAKLLGDVVPGLMVTDPPYGVNYDANWRNGVLDEETGQVKGKVGSVGRAIMKVTNDHRMDWREALALFPGDVAYVWHADRYATQVSEGLHAVGLENRNQIIWAKSHLVIGRGDYHWMHEPCWYAVREGGKSLRNDDRTQTTLWKIDKPQKSETGHSTQKPLECMLRPIRNHLIAEVYDPFLGSGTTMVAAENLERRCFGIEISPGYCAVILQRMADAFPLLKIERAP